jgi:zinc protease
VEKEMLNRTIPPTIKNAVDFNLVLKPCMHVQLDNKVDVCYINDGTEEVAMVELVFNAGNSYEPKNMVATAVNNLLKNGTSTKTAFEINEHFEYYGAYLNRGCQNEKATLTLHCLTKHLKVLLPVIRELITDSVFPQTELDIFQLNSIQRLSVNLQKCDFVANRLIDQYLYGTQHPYGRVSNAEDIKALTRDDLLAFFNNFYKRSQFRIFAAGRLPEDLDQLLNQYFGDLVQDTGISEIDVKKQMAREKKYRVDNDPNGVQGAIRIARPFPNRHHPDYKKVMVLNTLFGGFFGSRLMNNIREDKGFTYGIHSFLENHIAESAWVISTEAGKEFCEDAVKEIYREMEILRKELVDDGELLLVKNYMMGVNLGDIDGPFQVISKWKGLLVNDLDETYFYDSMNTIKKISARELRELANKYLNPADFFELVVI